MRLAVKYQLPWPKYLQMMIWVTSHAAWYRMVQETIKNVPIDLKRDMFRHVSLSGGTTLIPGSETLLRVSNSCHRLLSLFFFKLFVLAFRNFSRYHLNWFQLHSGFSFCLSFFFQILSIFSRNASFFYYYYYCAHE